MSEAPCDLCVYTGADSMDASPTFEADYTRKARKDYKCCECFDVIPKGTLYVRSVGKWDGRFNDYVTCLACDEIRRAFCCDGWIYGQLWEDFSEYFEHLTTACLDKLETAVAKQKLLDRWNAWRF